METDGVGLRMVLKVTIDMSRYVVPVPVTEPKKATASRPTRRPSKNDARAANDVVSAPHVMDPKTPTPVFAALDTGRAKLFMAAISRDGIKKPTSMGFTRSRYYSEMGFLARRRWEATIMAGSANLRAGVDALSRSGGIKNCDPECWRAYLAAETEHRPLLEEEFVDNIERAKWAMTMHRNKKRSLDGACRRLMNATIGPAPLVLGIGAAGFASGGRGELSAPTSELSKALKRAIGSERSKGRQVTVLSVDEFRTTMCCCACGEVTAPPRVRRRKFDPMTGMVVFQDGPSRRLRRCTTCDHAGKLRDRDVQGARNILWLTQALYYGLTRPSYLCRVPRSCVL